VNLRRAAVAVVVLLALCWGGYVAFVFAQESVTSQQETLVMTSGSAAPGGTVSAHVVARDHRTGEALPDSNVTVALVDDETEAVVDRGATDESGSYTATLDVPNRTRTS
jgi:hypothetical protein